MLSAREYARQTHNRRRKRKREREQFLGTYRTGEQKMYDRRENDRERKSKEFQEYARMVRDNLAAGILDDTDVHSHAQFQREKHASWKEGVKWTEHYQANKDLKKTNIEQFTTERVVQLSDCPLSP
jgi:hypothetical protein